ncbi:MAG: thiosulfate oxidation carrier complex protein SoxZ, partial [Pseudomonadota bacterium]
RGGRIPRNIITEFICLYDGAEIFRADFFPAVAANPFLTFYAKADKTGDLEFRWVDQHGETSSETVRLTVS